MTDLPDAARVELDGSGSEITRVLVVGDDPEMRSVIQEGLSALGFSVTTATDEMVALQLTSEMTFDIVVSDLHREGPATGAFLRQAAANPDSPGIIVIGSIAVGGCVREKRVPEARFIPRPFSIRELGQMIHLMELERKYGCRGLVSRETLPLEGVEPRRFRHQESPIPLPSP